MSRHRANPVRLHRVIRFLLWSQWLAIAVLAILAGFTT